MQRELARTEGRAELIDGAIVRLPLFGHYPGTIRDNLLWSLHQYTKSVGNGEVYSTTFAYIVTRLPSGRESFSPAVSFYSGPIRLTEEDFMAGPPTFAVELRRENADVCWTEEQMATKRFDYYQAGTRVVWKVDPMAEVIISYRDDGSSETFRRGETADAEPAVPSWRIAVDEVFE